MDNPPVTVADISTLLDEDLHVERKVQLGNPQIDAQVNTLLARFKATYKHAYVLRWEGGKIPRGVVVGGETIAWTQHGVVNNESGQMVGVYDRVVEFGGKSGREQVMIVYRP